MKSGLGKHKFLTQKFILITTYLIRTYIFMCVCVCIYIYIYNSSIIIRTSFAWDL